jgi:hypothetical protein
MRLLVTSVIRHADARSKSGFLSVVEWPSGRVLARLPVPESVHRAADTNPRGGTRGVRGVSVHDGRLLVANSETVFILDRSWRIADEISHPLMGGVHDVLAQEDGFWACCTNADLAVKFSWQGELIEHWDCRGDAAVTSRLGLEWAPPVRRDLDYRELEVAGRAESNLLHLNSLGSSASGLLVSLGRITPRSRYLKSRARGLVANLAGRVGMRSRAQGVAPKKLTAVPSVQSEGSKSAVVRLGKEGAEILHVTEGTAVPNHNADELDGRLLFNDSNSDQIVELALDGSQPPRCVKIPGEPPFARGLLRLGERRVLVGSQAPAALYEVDLTAASRGRSAELGGASNESVFAVCALPDDFDDPPEALR